MPCRLTGRTLVSGTRNFGSNPSEAATYSEVDKLVKSPGFDPGS